MYIGERTEGDCRVWVQENGQRYDLWEVTGRHSLNIFPHSPTGFEWGCGGSGPAQLALAMLLDHGMGAAMAVQLHQAIKFKLIGTLPREKWELTTEQVDEALASL